MKVLALTPFTTTGPGFRRATPDDLLARVRASDAQLVVLPGYSPGITPTPEQLKAAVPPGCTVFVETAPESEGPGKAVTKPPSKRADEPFNPCLPYLVTRDGITAIPRQLFARSPDRSQIEALRGTLKKRTYEIAGTRFTFVLCGEINGFDATGGLKHGLDAPDGIVINPAHTPMGRWHLLDAKLKALSRQNGMAVHVTNNSLKHPAGASTDVRVYRRGKWMPDRDKNDHSAWCAFETS